MFDNDEFIEKRKAKMDNDDITKRLEQAKVPVEKQIQNLAINCGFSKLILVGMSLEGNITQIALNTNLIETLGLYEVGKAVALKQSEVGRK